MQQDTKHKTQRKHLAWVACVCGVRFNNTVEILLLIFGNNLIWYHETLFREDSLEGDWHEKVKKDNIKKHAKDFLSKQSVDLKTGKVITLYEILKKSHRSKE